MAVRFSPVCLFVVVEGEAVGRTADVPSAAFDAPHLFVQFVSDDFTSGVSDISRGQSEDLVGHGEVAHFERSEGIFEVRHDRNTNVKPRSGPVHGKRLEFVVDQLSLVLVVRSNFRPFLDETQPDSLNIGIEPLAHPRSVSSGGGTRLRREIAVTVPRHKGADVGTVVIESIAYHDPPLGPVVSLLEALDEARHGDVGRSVELHEVELIPRAPNVVPGAHDGPIPGGGVHGVPGRDGTADVEMRRWN